MKKYVDHLKDHSLKLNRIKKVEVSVNDKTTANEWRAEVPPINPPVGTDGVDHGTEPPAQNPFPKGDSDYTSGGGRFLG